MGKDYVLYLVLCICLQAISTLIFTGKSVFFHILVLWYYLLFCLYLKWPEFSPVLLVFLKSWFKGHIDFPSCPYARLCMGLDLYVYLCCCFVIILALIQTGSPVFFVSWFLCSCLLVTLMLLDCFSASWFPWPVTVTVRQFFSNLLLTCHLTVGWN